MVTSKSKCVVVQAGAGFIIYTPVAQQLCLLLYLIYGMSLLHVTPVLVYPFTFVFSRVFSTQGFPGHGPASD